MVHSVLNTVPSRIVSRLEYSPHQKLEILIESSLKQSPNSNNIQNIVNIALQNYYIICLTRQERPSQTHHLLRRGYFLCLGHQICQFSTKYLHGHELRNKQKLNRILTQIQSSLEQSPAEKFKFLIESGLYLRLYGSIKIMIN